MFYCLVIIFPISYFKKPILPCFAHLRSQPLRAPSSNPPGDARDAMLLTKLKELKAAQQGDGGDEEATHEGAPSSSDASAMRGASAPSTSSGSVAAKGWAKTRIAGVKAARQQIRDNMNIQSEPDGAIRRLRGHAGPVHCLVLSPGDQRRLYSGGKDGTVRAWDHLEENGKCVLVMSGHTASVCALAVDPTSGKRLYSAGADNTVRVWMLTDGSCLRSTNLFEMTHADMNSYFVAPQRGEVSPPPLPNARIRCMYMKS